MSPDRGAGSAVLTRRTGRRAACSPGGRASWRAVVAVTGSAGASPSRTESPHEHIAYAFMSFQRFAICPKIASAIVATTPTAANGSQTAYCGS